MLNDITIGQYFPLDSVLHRLDPRLKLLLTIGYITVTFVSKSFISLGLVAVFLLILMMMSKVPLKMFLKGVKGILPLILIASLLNIFYGSGDPLISFWIFKITPDGLTRAGLMVSRILLLITVSSLLTYTTSPTELTDAIEQMLSPLKLIGLGQVVHVMAMMMTLALRFIPTLIEETQKLMSAQKARGADMESGGLFKRVRAMLPILIPLLVSAFRRAADLAEAMECRCYNGGKGRTRMKRLKFALRDLWGFLVFAAVSSAAVTIQVLM